MAKKGQAKKTSEQIKKEKVERFLRIAPVRVTKALKAIMLIGNCANSGYSYTPEQSQRIIDALNKAVILVTKQLTGVKEKTQEFTF